MVDPSQPVNSDSFQISVADEVMSSTNQGLKARLSLGLLC
jgi:hypothetical protein